jgi:glucose/arabinose dehydrogenase
MKKLIIISGAFLLLSFSLFARGEVVDERIVSEQAVYRLVKAVDGMPHPWGFAFLPGGEILITGRAGILWMFEPESGNLREISGLPEIRSAGQGGLLDIVLHPDYRNNGWIYMTHVVAGEGGNAPAVSRARLEGDRLRDLERIFTANKGGRTTLHFGSRLAFDSRGFLYVSLGERGEGPRAQDLSDHAGSTLRLTDDGRVPSDNPFTGDPDKADEIFSYGHRNPQGMALDPVTGTIWQHEHGPRGGDEINILRPGANYGWPVVTYGRGYDGSRVGIGSSAPGMEPPVLYWDPSIAPSGMTFYTGNLFPRWKGDLFAGALAGTHLRRIERRGDEILSQEVLLKDRIGRIRDVRQSPDGYLYVLTDEKNGSLYRLEPVQ